MIGMVGVVVWWLVCHALHVPAITDEMLDEVDAAIREDGER